MNEKNDFALVPRPPGALEKAEPGAKRVLAGMVDDTLALANKARIRPGEAKFRIGEYEWCEPDYRQILLWAEETGDLPEAVIERLEFSKSSFADGRLIKILWDNDAGKLIQNMRFIEGLKLKSFFIIPHITPVMLAFSGLKASDAEVAEINLEGLTDLEELGISRQNLTELNLRPTPNLKMLRCESNSLASINLSSCQKLEKVNLRHNCLTQIDLTNLPALRILECNQNRLSYLDLSGVPALEILDCSENRWVAGDLRKLLPYERKPIEVLDITPLKCLKDLKYDAGKTRLIQRPDQHF